MLSLSLVSVALAIAPALVAAQTPPYGGEWQLSNPIQLDGKKCVTPSGNGTAIVGSTLVISDCKNTAGQKTRWVNKSVRSGGLCWSAKSGNSTVSLATCNEADGNQTWYFNKFGGRQLKHNPTGRCLDLTNGAVANGTPVQLQTCNKGQAKQIWNPYYVEGTQPAKAAEDPSLQFGTNQCGTGSSQSANCQNIWINSLNDFCLYAPPTVGEVGNMEPKVVSWCLKSGRGTRLIPNGTLTGVHFTKTPTYVQISGVGDFTKMNIPKGDYGGELDPHGATGMGNPVGALVYSSAHYPNTQIHEWSSFISEKEFCFRACLGPDAQKDCPHIYDVMGCYWNQPANYDAGVFEQCLGDKTLPAGIYGTSTWSQGVKPTPSGHPPAASSQCSKQATVSNGPLGTTTPPTGPTTTSTQPPTTTTPSTGGKLIRAVANTNKCIAAASAEKGAAVIIQDCNAASPNQLWSRVGQTFRANGWCIDVVGGVDAKGTLLQTWSCGSGTNVNQQFTYNANGDKHITWAGKDKSLDVSSGNFTNGNRLQIWQRSTTTVNQSWNY
jgi:hypothetical protein